MNRTSHPLVHRTCLRCRHAVQKAVLSFIRNHKEDIAGMLDSDSVKALSPSLLLEVMVAVASHFSRKRAAEGDDLKPEQVKRLKFAELRAELDHRGLDTSGIKSDLVARLQVATTSS